MGNRFIYLIFLGSLVSALSTSCGGHEHTKPTGATCPVGSTLTYGSFGKDFFSKYCLGCHSTAVTGAKREDAPDDVNFDTVAMIKAHASHIDETAGASAQVVNESMPPSEESKQPTLNERKQLAEWIACGSPE